MTLLDLRAKLDFFYFFFASEGLYYYKYLTKYLKSESTTQFKVRRSSGSFSILRASESIFWARSFNARLFLFTNSIDFLSLVFSLSLFRFEVGTGIRSCVLPKECRPFFLKTTVSWPEIRSTKSIEYATTNSFTPIFHLHHPKDIHLPLKRVAKFSNLPKQVLLTNIDSPVVYFDQEMGAPHAVRWLKSIFWRLNNFFHPLRNKIKKKKGSRTKKTCKNMQHKGGLPAFRCYSLMLIDTQKLVDSFRKCDFFLIPS